MLENKWESGRDDGKISHLVRTVMRRVIVARVRRRDTIVL